MPSSLQELQRQAIISGITGAQDQTGARIAGSLMQADKDAQLKQLLLGKQIEEARKLHAENPKASVNIEGVSINPQDTTLRMQAFQDKQDQQERLETKAIQDEFNKVIGKSRQKAEALNEIENLLSSGSQLTHGQMSTALARAAGDVGALSEGDIKRALPSSLFGDVQRGLNYITGGGEIPLTEIQKKQVSDLIRTKRKSLEGELSRGQTELGGRAPYLAPTLSRGKKLPNVYRSLGIGLSQEKAPAANPKQDQINAIMNRIKELESK